MPQKKLGYKVGEERPEWGHGNRDGNLYQITRYDLPRCPDGRAAREMYSREHLSAFVKRLEELKERHGTWNIVGTCFKVRLASSPLLAEVEAAGGILKIGVDE